MTNIDKLVNVTWNHEDSKDFNCVAVDAININNPTPFSRQKLPLHSQPPQTPPNHESLPLPLPLPLPVLLYQHVALFCLRTCTPCPSPDSAVAASGRIDNLFLLQEKTFGGGRGGSGGAGSAMGAGGGGGGVGLQWYNINNTYSITMETRYQQPSSSSSSSSSGSPISSKLKSSSSRSKRGGAGRGNHIHSSGGEGADDLLKESLKVLVDHFFSILFLLHLCPGSVISPSYNSN